MRKLLTIVLYASCTLIAAGIAVIILSSKPLPRGKVGPEAESMTDSLLAAVNCNAWSRLRYVAWSYQGKRTYVWDKFYNLAEIHWGDKRVLINLNSLDGIVWDNGVRLRLEEKRKYLDEAWHYWCNDSFWLNPVCKLRDGGVVRRLVILKDGRKALLATYTRGGVTPGDSYLWILDENDLPTAWRMWVKALPIRGLEASWEDWTTLEDVKVSVRHRIGPYSIEILDLRGGSHHSDLGLDRDPFIDFVTQ